MSKKYYVKLEVKGTVELNICAESEATVEDIIYREGDFLLDDCDEVNDLNIVKILDIDECYPDNYEEFKLNNLRG